MDQPLKIGLIYGSTRPGRFCDVVANWVAEQVWNHERFALDLIDPAAQSDRAELAGLIDEARREWHAKSVAFVSYGGVSGGLRAVEHLRGVFAELHAVGIRDTVSFADAWEQFDEQGRMRHPERAERSLATLLARLEWWTRALRDARVMRAYGEAA